MMRTVICFKGPVSYCGGGGGGVVSDVPEK